MFYKIKIASNVFILFIATTFLNAIKFQVPVRIERVRLFLVSIEGLDTSLEHAEDNQAKIKLLENMFIDLRDIISLTREEARNANDNKDAQLLLSYLISVRVERTVQRNLLLIQQTRRAQDCVRLFDIIIQQLTELTQSDALKNDDRAQKAYQLQLLAYRALRAFYMAKAHAAVKRWKEAALLLDISKKYSDQIKERKFSKELLQLLKSMDDNVEVEKACAQAHFTLEQNEEEPSVVIPQKVRTC